MMQPATRISPCLAVLLCVVCTLNIQAQTQSNTRHQTTVPASNSSHTGTVANNQLATLIDAGKSLEIQGRWGEALSHYQQALKVLPENQQIKTRRSISRIHYDLNRRYADSKYVKSLTGLNGNNSLKMYAEILLKIQSYYVSRPDWDNILRHGLACMEIALSDQNFVKHNLANIDPREIQPAIDEMNSVLGKYDINTRQDAYLIANNVCRLMQRRLGLPIQSTVYEFTCGAIIALDPYSSFMTSNQYGETMSQIEGNFVGLGVELKTHADHLHIVNVIPKGPAGMAGLKSNDKIVSIDGNSVESLGGDVAADELRGIEGSFVSLGVISETAKQTTTIRLQRRRVEIPSVESVKIVDQQAGVGYLKLSNFQKTTVRDFDAALWQLKNQGMRSLIVDVRGNPGGLLNSAVEISDRFIHSGVIVSTRGRNPLEDYIHRAKQNGTWNLPLVVLIDGDSASASEIFAAAIQDHRRGTVIGEQSYGKGSVQGIFQLNVGGGGVRLTTAKFYSPDGSPISQVGVRPQVPVETVAKPTIESASNETTKATEVDDILRIGIITAKRQASQTGYSQN